jgi:hypothetical protein
MERRGEAGQLSFLCSCGKQTIQMKIVGAFFGLAASIKLLAA